METTEPRDAAKHAPLPWRFDSKIVVDADGEPVHSHMALDGQLVVAPSGEFVVRACNAHYDLIARATAAERQVRDQAISAARTQETFERVLEEAEAERRKAEAALAEAMALLDDKAVKMVVSATNEPGKEITVPIEQGYILVTAQCRQHEKAIAELIRDEEALREQLSAERRARELDNAAAETYRSVLVDTEKWGLELRERGEALARAGEKAMQEILHCINADAVICGVSPKEHHLAQSYFAFEAATKAWREIVPAPPEKKEKES